MTSPSKIEQVAETDDFPTERRLHGPYRTDPFGMGIYGVSDKGGDCSVLDVRGWGYLTGNGSGGLGLEHNAAMTEQKRFAAFVVWALNEAEASIRAALKEEK